MKVAYKEAFETSNKWFGASLIVNMILILIIIFLFALRFKNEKIIRNLESMKNTMVWNMDQSCYTQFTNNLDKKLFLQLQFEK
jgi:hypothetical protein